MHATGSAYAFKFIVFGGIAYIFRFVCIFGAQLPGPVIQIAVAVTRRRWYING
jgi:hypothetical protein